jgi:hypothetical protein
MIHGACPLLALIFLSIFFCDSTLANRVENFVNLLFVHLAIPLAFGINDHHRSVLALLQASGARNPCVQIAVDDFRLDILQQRDGFLTVADAFGLTRHPKACTNKNVMLWFFHAGSPFKPL